MGILDETRSSASNGEAGSVAFRELAESLPSLVWTCAPDGPCDYLGPQWVQYTGIPEAEQLGYGWLEQLHPDDKQPTIDKWQLSSSRGEPFEIEFRIRRYDGTYRWFATRAIPLRDDEGEIRKWLGINTDIEENRQAQAELRRLNAELESRVRARTEDLNHLNSVLRATASQLAEAESLARLGSWSLRASDNQVIWSDELFRIMGLDPELGEPPYEEHRRLFSDHSWKLIQDGISKALSTGEGYELEVDFQRPSGEVRKALARCRAVLASDGSTLRLVGTFQDITELFTARAERDRAAARARLATSAVGMGVWDWSLKTKELWWDPTMMALYDLGDPGAEAVVIQYEQWKSRLDPGDAGPVEEAVQAALAGKRSFNERFRVRLNDNSVRYVQGCARVFYEDDGEPSRMLGVNWDVTAEVELRSALVESEQLLQQFVKYAPAAIAMLDPALRYLHVSDKWLQDFRLEGRDMIGKSHYEVFPDVPPRWKEIHQRVLAGNTERCAEDQFPRADGILEWVQWEARPWRRPDGTVGGIIFFSQVITERKEMEELHLRWKQELERSNEDLERFAYSVSHDLQEPLRAVSGCAQILAKQYAGQLDSKADKLMRHMVEGTEQMRRLIEGLLSFSLLGRSKTNFRPLLLEDVMKDALSVLASPIQATGARVSYQELPHVEGDIAQLTQLFQNLISNALKYRSEKIPEVTVRARERSDCWQISVSDNGIGIEPRYHDRVFEMFQRLHSRAQYPGSGIGLTTCRRIVELHGGRLWVESEVGTGSVFHFTLKKRHVDTSDATDPDVVRTEDERQREDEAIN